MWECGGLYTENWGVDHTERKVERDGQDDGVKNCNQWAVVELKTCQAPSRWGADTAEDLVRAVEQDWSSGR